MAASTDLERLVVQLNADIKGYQSAMTRAAGIMNRQAREIESRWQKTNSRLDTIGRAMASSILTPLAGIGAALSVREVLRYADAWTSAKNSLAVAGITGAQQVDTLEALFQSAQKNATPIDALTDLFGKAAQASDNLGASQQELLRFSDGVAVALRVAGTSAGAASGALTQLGQLLGSARVQAEEFNSVNEGARPILIAVANGLDEAGGSVSRLKELVNDGKVSGQQFFQAFLRGLPSIQSMAANATETIDQGITKVNNALTRYIGQTDEGLSASQRLVAGLNTLADNFDATADVVLKVASVIAGALVGRSIAGMIAALGLAGGAVLKFVSALRAASTLAGVTAAIGGLSAAAGPLGLVLGGSVVAALALFASSSASASAGARTFAEALRQVEEAGKAAAESAKAAASGAQQSVNRLVAGIEGGTNKINQARDAASSLFSSLVDNAQRRLATPEQLQSLADLRDRFVQGSASAEEVKEALYKLANSNPNFQRAADQMAPLLTALADAIKATNNLKEALATVRPPSFRGAENASMDAYGKMLESGRAFVAEAERRAGLTKDQLALEKEIAEVRKEAAAAGVTLTDRQVKDLAQTRIVGDAARAQEGKAPKAIKASADSRFDQDIQYVRDRTAALLAEQQMIGQSVAAQEARRLAIELEQQALADLREEARRKGETDLESIQLAPEQVAAIQDVADAYGQQAQALQKAQQAFDDANDLARGFADDLASGLLNGASAAESLANALDNVADKLLDMALNALFDPSGGGFLAKLFGGMAQGGPVSGGIGRAATGGRIRGPGTGTSDSIPMMLSDGEYVVRAKQAKKFAPLLEAINSGRIGKMAAGGLVGSAPRIPSLAGMGRGGDRLSLSMPISINAPGADGPELARLRAEVVQLKREIPGLAVKGIRDARKRNVRV